MTSVDYSSTDEQGRNSWETPATDDPGKDDVAFTNELLDLLIENYCVDAYSGCDDGVPLVFHEVVGGVVKPLGIRVLP